ncbi:hypothetical protein [Pseudomonas fluorescens]|uniref:Uncharacterized protein n=1 Tax=Pseudomonas fluorescens TaxID=294 RepID=A0A5E7DWU4_PSEFL|nr:hypothetical protein [Pseudomonas fluorescens]VVO11972.1 hypothetical protein PS691_03479 [Pseudomonas fluorescens]
MNIAICLSGHPRTFKLAAAQIKKTFGEADFYFSTWSSSEDQELLETFQEHKFNLVGYEFISEPAQIENERKIANDFQDSFPDFFILNQWYGVKRVIRLMQDYELIVQKKYDFVFRCRFDLSINFSLDQAIEKSIPNGLNYVSAHTGGSDQFLYGPPEVMTHFLNFEAWLLGFSEKFGTQYGFFASPLVRAYFLDKNIPINRVDLSMKVLRTATAKAKEDRENRTRSYIKTHFPELSNTTWNGEKNIKHILKPGPWDKNYHMGKKLFLENGELK